MTVISKTRSHRQCRVWRDEPPDAPAGSECITRSLLTDEYVDETYRAVAVEKQSAHGRKVAYGLLGAEFRPSREYDRLDVSLFYTCEQEPDEFETTLGASWNHMNAGLSNEYVEGLMDFIECHAIKLGPGYLRFTCATVEPIGILRGEARALDDSIARFATHPNGVRASGAHDDGAPTDARLEPRIPMACVPPARTELARSWRAGCRLLQVCA